MEDLQLHLLGRLGFVLKGLELGAADVVPLIVDVVDVFEVNFGGIRSFVVIVVDDPIDDDAADDDIFVVVVVVCGSYELDAVGRCTVLRTQLHDVHVAEVCMFLCKFLINFLFLKSIHG